MSFTSITTNDPHPAMSDPAPGDRGSAIMLVVAIGALVTLLVFTWVMFSVKRYHAVIDNRDNLRARYAAESVVSQVVYEKTINPNDSMKRNDGVLINAGADTGGFVDDPLTYTDSLHGSSATATAGEEGSYFRVKAQGTAGKAVCDIDALFGIELPAQYRFALILFGGGSENTVLEIKRGQIIGDANLAQKPNGNISGKIEQGAGKPTVNTDKFETEIRNFEKKLQIGDSGETVLPTTQTFTDKSPPSISKDKNIFVNGNILIENRSRSPLIVKGPGTIIATGDIQISGTVVIDNVEILALGNVQCFDDARLQKAVIYSKQMIGFGDKVTFSGNLYATTKLVMAGQAATEMPTFAYVKGDPAANSEKKGLGLQITQQSRFFGTFYCQGPASVSLIERDTRFTGLFYSMGHLILEGVVFGCVAAQSLVESDLDVGKANVLAGGTINRKILPKNFIIPCAFTQSGTTYRLVSWTMSPPDPADAKAKEAAE